MCTTRVCAVCLTADKNGSHFGVQREPSASHMDREIWLGAALCQRKARLLAPG